MGIFQDDTHVTGKGGKLVATLSRDWEIWGPNGGYVAAIALRAAGAAAPPGHRPATVSVQYLSPAKFAEVDCEVEPVRKGRNAWCLNVALVQEGKRFLQAQVWTTDKAEGPRSREHVMPDVPKPAVLMSWDEYLPKDAPRSRFWSNIESKPLKFPEPGERQAEAPTIRAWYRFRDFAATKDSFLDSGRPLLLIDTLLWPAHAAGLASPPDYIAPSLDVSAWFHELPGESEWLFVDAHSGTAGDGLIHGLTRVWSEDARLIATGGSQMLHMARTMSVPVMEAK